jgi:hypothetical protein
MEKKTGVYMASNHLGRGVPNDWIKSIWLKPGL